MAFESLTEKFKRIFKSIRGQAHLTEANMDAMLKEVREATEGQKVNISGEIKAEMQTTEERLKAFNALMGKNE